MSDGQDKKESESTDITKDNKEAVPVDAQQFEHLPPEAKKQILEMTSMFMASGPMPHPIFTKMNTEQVGEVIKNMESECIREHNNKLSSRRFNFATFVCILVFVLLVFTGCLLKEKWEYVVPIITAIGGFGGGIGVAAIRNQNND